MAFITRTPEEEELHRERHFGKKSSSSAPVIRFQDTALFRELPREDQVGHLRSSTQSSYDRVARRYGLTGPRPGRIW